MLLRPIPKLRNMNKLVLLFLPVAVCAGDCAAQIDEPRRVQFGARAMFGGSYLMGAFDAMDDYSAGNNTLPDFCVETLPTVGGGVSMTATVRQHWSIETGLYYQMRGVRLEEDFCWFLWDDEPDYLAWRKTNAILHYVKLPVLLRFSHQIGMRPLAWEAKAGPYVSVAAGGRSHTTAKAMRDDIYDDPLPIRSVTSKHKSHDLFDDKEMEDALNADNEDGARHVRYESQRMDCGITLGGGVTFWRRLYVGVENDWGILSVMKLSGEGENHKLRNETFSLVVGYNF